MRTPPCHGSSSQPGDGPYGHERQSRPSRRASTGKAGPTPATAQAPTACTPPGAATSAGSVWPTNAHAPRCVGGSRPLHPTDRSAAAQSAVHRADASPFTATSAKRGARVGAAVGLTVGLDFGRRVPSSSFKCSSKDRDHDKLETAPP